MLANLCTQTPGYSKLFGHYNTQQPKHGTVHETATWEGWLSAQSGEYLLCCLESRAQSQHKLAC